MAGLTSAQSRGQLAAITVLRWQLFLHSLRTLGGRMEAISRVFAFFGFAVMGFGGALGFGFGSWWFVDHNNVENLAFFFWPIFLYWQLFPVLSTAFAENVDFSNLLRFPLSFRSYLLVRVVFGAADPSTLVGCLWLLGIIAGTAIANFSFLPLLILVCLLFALFNLLLARAIFSWVERWLATRRAREIMGVLFLLVVISFQFITPAIEHFSGARRHPLEHFFAQVLPFQRVFPPGLAASSLARAVEGDHATALGSLAILAAYCLAALWFLVIRLTAQYSGENLSEAAARPAPSARTNGVSLGWSLPGLPSRYAAIIEKEFHYLSRSGPVLFTLIMPVVILLIFRVTPANSANPAREHYSLLHTPDYAFPVGAAYSMLILTNILYNAFGADGPGIQVLYLLPVKFREILLAKNIAYGIVLAFEMLLVWVATAFLYRPPAPGITVATLAGVLFAFLANLAAGNLLSLYTPKKFDTAVLGRQRLPTGTVFASLGIQIAVLGLGALVLIPAIHWGNIWAGVVLLFCLAALGLIGYLFSLRAVDRIALSRRENLISELTRA